jgi:hypothetical protein
MSDPMTDAQKNAYLIAAIQAHRLFKENFDASPTDEWDRELWKVTEDKFWEEWEEDE